ncbi:hypothetical protein AAE478_008134 [Parahypoxylon ruwenzoriense]
MSKIQILQTPKDFVAEIITVARLLELPEPYGSVLRPLFTFLWYAWLVWLILIALRNLYWSFQNWREGNPVWFLELQRLVEPGTHTLVIALTLLVTVLVASLVVLAASICVSGAWLYALIVWFLWLSLSSLVPGASDGEEEGEEEEYTYYDEQVRFEKGTWLLVLAFLAAFAVPAFRRYVGDGIVCLNLSLANTWGSPAWLRGIAHEVTHEIVQEVLEGEGPVYTKISTSEALGSFVAWRNDEVAWMSDEGTALNE